MTTPSASPMQSADPLIDRAAGHSRHLAGQLSSRPWLRTQLAALLDRPLDAQALDAFVTQAPEQPLAARLRHLRSWVIAHLATRDLAGLAPLDEVVTTMTDFANVAVRHAHDAAAAELTERFGTPRSPDGEAQTLQIVGMGKLGGGELNVSSDIDLVFLYPEDGETDGARSLSNFEFFARLGRRLIALLAEITEHGQVFRVDMRLRPHGDSGPLACSFEMLETYLISQGREWERYAWIKARLMLGNREDLLLQLVRPFVFRRYLDFGAIEAMRELHAQLRSEVARRDRQQNIKLGPGGIREIEFIAQAFQLIRGGREPSLRIRPTLAVLTHLSEHGALSIQQTRQLQEDYVFLRRLEHRIQYLDDAQTHDLPAGSDDQRKIAESMGFASFAEFADALAALRERVSAHFHAVFAESADQHALQPLWQQPDAHDGATFVRHGFQEGERIQARLQSTRAGRRYTQMPERNRRRFDALIPRLIDEAVSNAEPDLAFNRGLDFLEHIAGRAAYLALLLEYPQALHRVVALLGASSWASQFLAAHPIVLDELLDSRNLNDAPDWRALDAELGKALAAASGDIERQMDLMRERHHAEVFRLLLQDLNGVLSVEALTTHLSTLADIMLRHTVTTCWGALRKRHCDTPRFAIISYGKLGGRELGYASDLDIVFLFDDPHPDAAEHYARLAQRISTWMSSRTPAGILFETDLRLRPNGDSGLLVSSTEAFARYQHDAAWMWEHQALTRARFSAGDAQIGADFERIRHDVLCQPRDVTALKQSVLDMRQKMRDANPPRDGRFHLKHGPGGLIDLEFIVQLMVLAHSHRHPALTENIGNIALLHRAADLDLLPEALAGAAADAYRQLRACQHRQRLNERPSHVSADTLLPKRAAISTLWKHVFAQDA